MAKKCVKLLKELRRINLGIKENRLPGVLVQRNAFSESLKKPGMLCTNLLLFIQTRFRYKFSVNPGYSSRDIEWLALNE